MSAENRVVRKVRPMNKPKKAIDWPVALPSSLSEDAQTLYGSGATRTLDRDPFDRAIRNRFVPREEQEAYVASERVLVAAAELNSAALGSYEPEYRTLYATAVHEHYTFAEGRGTQLIHVYALDPGGYVDKRLLAVLVGADIESRSNTGRYDISETWVNARHWDATDAEHDASSTALLKILNPTAPTFTGYGRMAFTGLLVEAHLYGLGVDPLTVGDGDVDPGDVCTDCKKQHPFAPYQPPKIDSISERPILVQVECLPIRPYLVQDQTQQKEFIR